MNYYDRVKRQHGIYFNLLFRYNLHPLKKDHWIYAYKQMYNKKKQGFKIHLSANTNNAINIAKKFLNYNETKQLDFKIVSTLAKFDIQNTGALGYSQIGKLITIYPNDDDEFLYTLNELELIFKSDLSPEIPSDFRYMLSSVVNYRYGEIVVDPNFNDLRDKTIPSDIIIPVDDYYIPRLKEIPKHLLLLKVIKKTGKGGTYQCLDLKRNELVLLKQGIHQGDLTIDNVDTINLLSLEKRSLLKLNKENQFPTFIDDFYLENSYFLEINYLNKETLYQFMKKKPLSPEKIKSIILKIISVVKLLHEKYNIIHRDISFDNVLIDEHQEISVIDFEFSYDLKQWNPPSIIMGTPGFYNANRLNIDRYTDVYSIISLLYFMDNFDLYCNYKNDHNKLTLQRNSIDKGTSSFYFIYLQAQYHYARYSLDMLEHDLRTLSV
ncbi:protein kinase domain-containing protein [Enterococcus faecium]|uniref:class III lanthionine synthetase LanKC N-terminal domain-containing protein n=3 Tax=Enterococcus faecium TaxID=1352 RepID=UPI0031012317